jgi:hypothetical protein
MTRRGLFGLVAAAIAGRKAAPARPRFYSYTQPPLYFLETTPSGGSKLFRHLYLAGPNDSLHVRAFSRIHMSEWQPWDGRTPVLGDEIRVVVSSRGEPLADYLTDPCDWRLPASKASRGEPGVRFCAGEGAHEHVRGD